VSEVNFKWIEGNVKSKCGQRWRIIGVPPRTIGRNAQNRCGGAVNKKSTQVVQGLVVALAGLSARAGDALAAETSAPPLAEERAGLVKSVRGDVQLLSGSTKTRAAAAGDTVAPIDRLSTGPDSGASVVLRDGTTLVVGPSSRMDLKQFHFDSTTQEGGMVVSLLRGTLRMVTGLIGKTHPDAVRVETQSAVIGIRGTDFIVETDSQP
jgi:hypothetical protein